MKLNCRAISLLVMIPLIFTVRDVDAKDLKNKENKVWLECSYKSGNETRSKKFLINTKNKTIEYLANGELLDVKSFDEDAIAFDFNHEEFERGELEMLMVINRRSGEYSERVRFINNSWNFIGSCKKISSPKPLF